MLEPWSPESEPGDLESVRRELERILWAEVTPTLLAEYFDPHGGFGGSWFDRLESDPWGPNQFGIHDLLAITFLDVEVPSHTAARILFAPDVKEDLKERLTAVPEGTPLWEAGQEAYQAAERAFEALGKLPGIGPVIAGKLLARKRPELVPITDSVVPRGLVRPGETDLWSSFWHVLRGALDSEKDLVRRLAELKEEIPEAAAASLLRILDVALWMTYSDQAAPVRNRLSVEG
jgi:hypothetical protein